MGVLGWPPSEFWKATPFDLYLALAGWQEKNGIGDDGADDGAAMTMAELEDLMARFPDEPAVTDG